MDEQQMGERVKRYVLSTGFPREHADGKYVLAKDYDALIEQRDRLRELLAMLYDKWEDGDPCYQDADITCDSLGNAFKLTDEEENSVLAALKGNTE